MDSIWDFAPEWANWLASDSNGDWYWYEHKPSIDCINEYNGSWRVNNGKYEYFCECVCGCWNNSLQQRPTLKLDQENTEDEFLYFNKDNLGIGIYALNNTTIINSSETETVNHPAHYNQVPGIECIDVVSHFGFTIGNIIKYCWRAGNKYNTTKLEDLKKAKWYLEYAIAQEEKLNE